MNTYLHDGTTFGLDIAYLDVTGVEWRWTGSYNEAGEPLMGSPDEYAFLAPPFYSLPDLYATHGPLIPTPRRATAALYRHVLQQPVAS
ncbi:phiSA1p31-related protein [Streptomyces prasinopilosus]|uniref:phiSA1p31-related protein n=1 Tax=Streptomyces prasinopilosus TaxID=67344 RepID=UPI0006EB2D33|nr:phiSA1p31-related protein [Streptomyces prasinopilosus]